MSYCTYQNIFGAPNTGLHSYRIYNIAVIDVIFTFIFAYFIQIIIEHCLSIHVNYFYVCILLFLFGIVCHRLFCVKTTIDKLLF